VWCCPCCPRLRAYCHFFGHNTRRRLSGVPTSVSSIELVAHTPTSPTTGPWDAQRAAARDYLKLKVKEDGDAVFVVDLGTVYRMMRQWTSLLPRVDPFYAVSSSSPLRLAACLLPVGACLPSTTAALQSSREYACGWCGCD
jgi:hypothetical protein